MRWRAVCRAIAHLAVVGHSRDRVIVAIVGGLLLLFGAPTMGTLLNPAPVGRTTWGVKRRLDRDLPIGTSADSAVAYLNRIGVHYVIAGKPPEILGWEDGVLPAQFPYQGDLNFRILFDANNRVRGDTVYEEVTGM
jgi:hypothetical protein